MLLPEQERARLSITCHTGHSRGRANIWVEHFDSLSDHTDHWVHDTISCLSFSTCESKILTDNLTGMYVRTEMLCVEGPSPMPAQSGEEGWEFLPDKLDALSSTESRQPQSFSRVPLQQNVRHLLTVLNVDF